MVTEKPCSRCQKVKPVEAFRRKYTGKLKLESWCKQCNVDYKRQVQAPVKHWWREQE